MKKKKVCKKCKQHEKRIEELEEQLAVIRFELDQVLENKYKSKKKRKPGHDDDPKPPPKKRGGVFGHKGWFRKKPKEVDKIEKVKLTRCPECGNERLKKYPDIVYHEQEDIVLPEVETTLFCKQMYYCNRCKNTVYGKGTNELPNSYIGPVAKALAVFLKFQVKVSDRDICELFKKMFNLKIAHSSIVGFRDQLKRGASDIYEALKESLKQGRFIHVDETGSNLDGKNAWRWKFSNKNVCITHTDRSRGQKVVEEILGEKYDGVLITDFLSAYNKIMTPAKQRCLVHILRDLKKVTEYWHEDDETMRYCNKLKKIFEEGIGLHKKYQNTEWDDRFFAKRKHILRRLNDFAFPNPNKKILVRFAKRLNRHKDELFTFLYEKGIDYHNNHAEQQIRPDVLLRKITFGNRSEKGAKVHDVVMSVIQTAKLNVLDPIKTLHDILLPEKENPFAQVLCPP